MQRLYDLSHFFVVLYRKFAYIVMYIKFITAILLLGIAVTLNCQTSNDINQVDANGKKQGFWIKKYPDGQTLYEGSFRDDKPVGEFKRYYEDGTLQSFLVYSDKKNEAFAEIYYPNGYIASKGLYVNQAKEGKWQFFSFSSKDTLISEEYYSKGKKNGLSVNYYLNGIIAEKLYYVNGIRHGECLKYHESGALNLRASYVNGQLDGSFEAYYENGNAEFIGQYKNSLKAGTWKIFREDGELRFEIEYEAGMPKNRALDIYETERIDSLEKNIVKIPDPEKTQQIW